MKTYYNKKSLKGIILSIYFIAFIIVIFTMNISIEKPIIISNNVIDSIYSENNFDYKFYSNYVNNIDYIDNNITNESLQLVRFLTIDANNLGNNDFFKYTTNLEELTINNYQNLKTTDIANLKYLKSLKTLHINIDGNYILKNNQYTINLSMLKSLETLYINCNLPTEIDSYIAYNLIKNNNIKNIIFSDNLNIDNLKNWDNQINKIITSLKLDNDTDKQKILKISNYITKHLKYDEEILNYLDNNSNKNHTNKIINYNSKLLSSILNNKQNIKDAICCNYAAFANILLFKANIEAYYITGNVSDSFHAWNLVNINNNYYFLDLTYLDNASNYDLLISSNMKNYKLYSNYVLPSDEKANIKTTYYNTNAPKIIIRWNNYILNLI